MCRNLPLLKESDDLVVPLQTQTWRDHKLEALAPFPKEDTVAEKEG